MLLFHSSFFFNHTATTEIYTLSLHDALPIYRAGHAVDPRRGADAGARRRAVATPVSFGGERISDRRRRRAAEGRARSEEHTSELQSRRDLVCRLLLEKKKKKNNIVANNSINA